MTKPRSFRQSDLERALRAAKALGLNVTGYRIQGDQIEVLTGEAPARELTPAEQWRAQRDARRSA